MATGEGRVIFIHEFGSQQVSHAQVNGLMPMHIERAVTEQAKKDMKLEWGGVCVCEES